MWNDCNGRNRVGCGAGRIAVDIEANCADSEALVKTVKDLKLFSSKADSTLEMLVKADSNWFVGTFMKMIK